MNKILINNREKVVYLLVGVWNTFFGLLVFFVLHQMLQQSIHYLIILTISYVISITNAYICYKIFVFKTKGNYFKEYIRFYVVYAIAFLINIVILSIFVESLKINTYISQIVAVCFIVIVSFLGHKYFSFQLPIDKEIE